MPKLITHEKLNRIKEYVNAESPFNCTIYHEQGKCPPHRTMYIGDSVEITMKGIRFSFDVRKIRYAKDQERKQRLTWLEGIVSDAIYQVLD
jgi:hypothetical protein